jgi:RIO kinase 1
MSIPDWLIGEPDPYQEYDLGPLKGGDLHRMVRAGVVHADLSAHNILWWEDRTWIIDVPQAVDLVVNIHAFDFLIRDLRNVGAWFTRRRIAFDADAIFSDLLSNLSP